MEPDGAESVNQEPKQTNAPQEQPEISTTIVDTPINVDTRVTVTVSEQTQGPMTVSHEEEIIPAPDSQNFFPSFAELFANHRLSYTEQQQNQRYRPNRFLGYFQRDRNAYQPAASSTVKNTQHSLLGSGNFGVIRGGTYYPEEKENDEYTVDETLYNPYYTGNTPRGRTNYYRNPKPQPIRGGDFFANFRDFADITAPPKSSFSHLSVVYANRNGTEKHAAGPRNIIETLKMLEDQNDDDVNGVLSTITTTTTTELPTKKISQGKKKLQNMKKYHEEKNRKYRMTVEPLLALS